MAKRQLFHVADSIFSLSNLRFTRDTMSAFAVPAARLCRAAVFLGAMVGARAGGDTEQT